jgi:hypothetical protein
MATWTSDCVRGSSDEARVWTRPTTPRKSLIAASTSLGHIGASRDWTITERNSRKTLASLPGSVPGSRAVTDSGNCCPEARSSGHAAVVGRAVSDA